MPLTDPIRDQINAAIFVGRKVEAIKLYREATGKGLKESKEFIEQLTDSLREQYPGKVPASSAGCGSAVVLFVLTMGAILYSLGA